MSNFSESKRGGKKNNPTKWPCNYFHSSSKIVFRTNFPQSNPPPRFFFLSLPLPRERDERPGLTIKLKLHCKAPMMKYKQSQWISSRN